MTMKKTTGKDIVNKINERRSGYFTLKMLMNRLKNSGIELPESTTSDEDIVFDDKIRTQLKNKINDLKEVSEAIDGCGLDGPEMKEKRVMW